MIGGYLLATCNIKKKLQPFRSIKAIVEKPRMGKAMAKTFANRY